MLSKRDIIEISCKVLGLYCLIHGIPYIASALSSVVNTNTMNWRLPVFTVSIVVFYYTAAFILIKWAKGIAAMLSKEEQPLEIKAESGWQEPVYTLCLRVVGAIAIIRAIPGIMGGAIQLIIRSKITGISSSTIWIQVIIHAATLALGIYFIGGAKAIVKIAMKGSLRDSDSNGV